MVDDSITACGVLTQGLSVDPEIEVVGNAANPYIARDKILQCRPDVLTLDVEMPRMDGVEFLRRLMPQNPLPVLMVSSLTHRGKRVTFEALEAGAVDFITKPSSYAGSALDSMLHELRTKVKNVSTANVSHWQNVNYRPPQAPKRAAKPPVIPTDKIIAIGASTGGTEAIRNVLCRLEADTPGIVVVQHMPPGFTKMLAQRLNEQCALEVKEAVSGDVLMIGQALIAPGDYHMTVQRSENGYRVECKSGDKVCGHRPSVDVLFHSIAASAGANSTGVILTGMGYDGAEGLVSMRRAGAKTLAQDESTSVVFGMPKSAYERGGTKELIPLDHVAKKIMTFISERS